MFCIICVSFLSCAVRRGKVPLEKTKTVAVVCMFYVAVEYLMDDFSTFVEPSQNLAGVSARNFEFMFTREFNVAENYGCFFCGTQHNIVGWMLKKVLTYPDYVKVKVF